MWPFKTRQPKTSPRPMVGVRMEAIGGQGANSAGKILAQAAVMGMEYTGNHFSSFGSEKRGSPVRSFVRFSPDRQPVRSASFIAHPQLLIAFHESMLKIHTGCLEGVTRETDLLLNTPHAPHEVKLPRGVELRNVYTVDASRLARRHGCGLNAVLLGAALHGLPEIQKRTLSQALELFFSKLSPQEIKRNLKGFEAGFRSLRKHPFQPQQAQLEIPHGALPPLGWQNAPIGALILGPGNTVLKNNSMSRNGIVPKFIPEICCDCGFCDMVCPDYCFVWEKDPDNQNLPTLKGIDYQFCKGCQKCISICPVDALVPEREEDLPPKAREVHLFPNVTPQAVKAQWQGTEWDQVAKELIPDGRNLLLQKELLDPKTYLKPDFSKTPIPSRRKKSPGDETP